MENNLHLIKSAGGNPTLISIIKAPLSRKQYEIAGNELLKKCPANSVEQVGFLIPTCTRFEMAGGEFCGNATRAAALLLSYELGKNHFTFHTSGFNGQVKAAVTKTSTNTPNVSVEFEPMQIITQPLTLQSGANALLVDLGGIVHILLKGEVPENFREYHMKITRELNLVRRAAVGTIWYQQTPKGTTIDPIVWVKKVNTFYRETSCGSASIAVGAALSEQIIIQPTGQPIFVDINRQNTTVTLTSEMTEGAVPTPTE